MPTVRNTVITSDKGSMRNERGGKNTGKGKVVETQSRGLSHQLLVQELDDAIQRINHYPLEKYIVLPNPIELSIG